ncbi:MAG: hypothetical protein LBF12_05655 [Christensenellaceae bacterium]|jgi:predicted small secreted protein|nr:hypothetical protein [Christensenellaceae bacterium]
MKKNFNLLLKKFITGLALLLFLSFAFSMSSCVYNTSDENGKDINPDARPLSGDNINLYGQLIDIEGLVFKNVVLDKKVITFNTNQEFIEFLQSINSDLTADNALVSQLSATYNDEFFSENIICYTQFWYSSSEFDASEGKFNFIDIYESDDLKTKYIVFDLAIPQDVSTDDLRFNNILIKTNKSEITDLSYEVRVVNRLDEPSDSYYYEAYEV